MTKDEALDLALKALEMAHELEEGYGVDFKKYGLEFDKDIRAKYATAITAIKQARSAPVQEPVAWVDWLPEGTTHIAKCKATTSSGGSLSLRTHAFKYEADVLKVYTTDNDNEYPGWRAAKDVFYHLNFAIVPIYTTTPAAQRQWVGLTQDEFRDFASTLDYGTGGLIRAIEAKLKEKNT
jgi:hypothetical protein